MQEERAAFLVKFKDGTVKLDCSLATRVPYVVNSFRNGELSSADQVDGRHRDEERKLYPKTYAPVGEDLQALQLE